LSDFYTKASMKLHKEGLAPFLLQALAWLPVKALLHFFLKLKIVGRENIASAVHMRDTYKVGAIFAMNHTSELDPIVVLMGISPFSSLFPMHYVTYRDKVYKNTAHFGWRSFIYGERFFRLWGGYPSQSGHRDYSIALQKHVTLLKEMKSLTIFPEGNISRTGVMGKAHGGLGYLASELPVIILPVAIAIQGGANVAPSDFFLRRRRITLIYGKPVLSTQFVPNFASQGDEVEQYRAIGQYLLNQMQEMLHSVSAKRQRVAAVSQPIRRTVTQEIK
jgi:1-acyl-sn-glycerol-3-phosphate acyltransferase